MTHIHAGNPTIPNSRPGALGNNSIPIARSRMVAIACNASARGSAVRPHPVEQSLTRRYTSGTPTSAVNSTHKLRWFCDLRLRVRLAGSDRKAHIQSRGFYDQLLPSLHVTSLPENDEMHSLRAYYR